MSDIEAAQLGALLDGLIDRHLSARPLPDRHDAAEAASLWSALHASGLTLIGLGGSRGGFDLDRPAQAAVFARLAGADASLACALALHVTACELLAATAGGSEPRLNAVAEGAALGFVPRLERGGLRRSADGSALTGSIALATPPRAIARWLPLRDAEPSGGAALIADDAEGIARRAALPPMGLRRMGWIGAELAGGAAVAVASAAQVRPAVANLERRLCAVASGMITAAARAAGEYANGRYQGGRKIGGHDAVREIIGRALVEAETARALALCDPPARGSAWRAARSAAIAAIDLVQVYGGYGYMEDIPIERTMRDAAAMEALLVPQERDARSLAALCLTTWEAGS